MVAATPPASLSGPQLAAIYRCDAGARSWSAFGGAAVQINPQLPAAGTGLRAEFLRQLRASNSGTDLTPGACADQSRGENDVAGLAAVPGSVAPVSVGRTKAATSIRLVGGYAQAYALGNVVRSTDATTAGFQAVFGPGGYLCSPAARAQIEAAGFRQLAPVAQSGVCGVATTGRVRNLTEASASVATSTKLTVESALTTAGATAARLTAVVAPASGTAPATGKVSFFEGATRVGTDVAVTAGRAVLTVPAAAGRRTYRAVYTPTAGTGFQPSEGTASGVVKAKATLQESFAAKTTVKVKRVDGKKKVVVKPVRGTITVLAAGITTPLTGTVSVKAGSRTVATGTVVNGSVRLELRKLKRGPNRLTIDYSGDAAVNAAKLSFTVKAKRAR